MSNQEKALIVMAFTGLGAVTLGLWALVSVLSPGVLRAWPVLSIILMPVIFFAGWRLGTRDARAHLSGLDKGIDKVMKAAEKTAGLRVSTVGRVRQARQTPIILQEPLRLPDPEIIHVQAATDDVVDL